VAIAMGALTATLAKYVHLYSNFIGFRCTIVLVFWVDIFHYHFATHHLLSWLQFAQELILLKFWNYYFSGSDWDNIGICAACTCSVFLEYFHL
jgi:hypothetical protein